MSEYYGDSTKRDVPENRETCDPGSVLAFHVLPTARQIRRSLAGNPFRYPQCGDRRPSAKFASDVRQSREEIEET